MHAHALDAAVGMPDAAEAARLAEVLRERGPCTLAEALASLDSEEC